MFDISNVNITVEEKRHLGAIFGSDGYKREYVDELVKDWNSQLCMLSTVAESQPQAAYSAFVNGFKNKLCYFIRTIPDISNLLLPIEDIIQNRFIPAITGGRICSEEERKILSLPTRYGGLVIPIFHEQAEVEYNNSRRITTELTSLIIAQQMEYMVDELTIKKIKLKIKNEKENRHKNVMEHLKDNMSEKSKRLLQLSTERSVSNWLTMLPIAEYGFELSK